MTFNEIIALCKTVDKASMKTGFTRATLYNWCKAGKIPLRSQAVIELKLKGALKADKK